MIARIFDKSKPINFVIVFSITLLGFISLQYKIFQGNFNLGYIIQQLTTFLLCLFTMSLLNFIVSKNNLTKASSYKILLFSLFFAIIPLTMDNSAILISNIFVLLALRRIISLRSLLKVKKKLLDASVLIAIASLFHFWSILFILLVLAGLLFYSQNNLKNWIIPFIGLLTSALIYVAYHILRFNEYGDPSNFVDPLSFDYENYNSLKMIIGITVLISFGIWASLFYIKSINQKLKTFRPSFIIIMIMAIIAVIVAMISPNKNGSELLFLFAPLAIIITNYIEVIEEKWFKEIFISILILIPISFQFF
ncbi:MAG: hypothetical protein KJP09_07185 [Bacteroidia bacterium]|nr:hypothetical protein [Bacteroidia bacterium]MBT8309535.1 hypothetical protein [Bacteroidia bacterium]NND10441.1 hypothetical protein [Flavobacteriaceae bacterium]NNK27401.1 hypothetical protein [Flavobacteriaceae bacterium]NNL59998.1 hypothetical protein [Flavobacteriaceae bacterium]